MKCERVNELLPDLLAGSANESERVEVQAHCAGCPACKDMVEGLGALWTNLGQLPDERPSEAMRPRFDAMLEAYQQGMHASGRETSSPSRQTSHGWIERLWPRQPVMQFAAALACIVVGLAGGRWLLGGGAEIQQLQKEVHATRQLVTLSLLQQNSPSERLKGVTFGARLDPPDPEVLSALLNVLNEDPNVNVRLAAADALVLYKDQPTVRQGLVQSFRKQKSPLVQIALIDLLVQMRERDATTLLQQLSKDTKVDQAVRQRASWGLQRLL